MSTDLQTNLLRIPQSSALCECAVVFSQIFPFVLTCRGELLVKYMYTKYMYKATCRQQGAVVITFVSKQLLFGWVFCDAGTSHVEI